MTKNNNNNDEDNNADLFNLQQKLLRQELLQQLHQLQQQHQQQQQQQQQHLRIRNQENDNVDRQRQRGGLNGGGLEANSSAGFDQQRMHLTRIRDPITTDNNVGHLNNNMGGGGNTFSLGIGSCYDNSSVNRPSSLLESPLRPSNGGQFGGQRQQQQHQQHGREETPILASGTMGSPIQFSCLAESSSSRPHSSSFTMCSGGGGSNNVDFGTTAASITGGSYNDNVHKLQRQQDNSTYFDGSQQSTHSSYDDDHNRAFKSPYGSSNNAKNNFVASRRNSIFRPAAGMRIVPQAYKDCSNNNERMQSAETTTNSPVDNSQNLSPLSPCTLRLQSQSYSYQVNNVTQRRTDPPSTVIAGSDPMPANATTTKTGQPDHPSRLLPSADNLGDTASGTMTVMTKRRRVVNNNNSSHNSDMMLLEMLNDTVVDSPASSPTPAAAVRPSVAVHGAGTSDRQSRLASIDARLFEMLNATVMGPATAATTQSIPAVGRSPHSSGGNLDGASAPFNNPYSNYAKPISALQQQKQFQNAESARASSSSASLTRTNQMQAVLGLNNDNGAYEQNSMMMMMSACNNTPNVFADLFLGTPGSANGNVAGLDVVGAMPPPPLVSMFDPNKSNQSVSDKRHRGLDDDSLLPLPPVRKSQQQKKSRKGQKKSTVDTSNHIITPSSSTILALSKEIRSKMKEGGEKAAAASKRDGEDQTAHSCAATNTSCGKPEANDADDKFVPRFACAMEATQASQQAIHDWDRKFGLRRAHSKTMRETCRSRKRVLEFLKGEGAEIALLKKSLSASDKTKYGSNPGASVVVGVNDNVLGEKNREKHDMAVDEQDNVNSGAELHDEMLEADECSGASTGRQESFQHEVRQDHALFSPSSSSQSRPVPQITGVEHRGHHSIGQFTNNSIIDIDRASLREHEDTDKEVLLHQKNSQDGGCSNSSSSSSSKLDEQHVQLEQMFRRASLDYVDSMLPVGTLCRPAPQEADRKPKQYHARGA